MTNTETKFRNWCKKAYPEGFIKKIPDYKQLGSAGAVGLPDYLLINKGKTVWYEVKSGFGDTITWRHFTPGQKVTFRQMLKAGADVKIFCFTKTKGQQIILFSTMFRYNKVKFN